jgi:alpha-maltose-1-phosphate synthase
MRRSEHVDPVPQWRLKEFYARAHVFALASREEGLALVQAQALASGLPIVCTDRTGGQDLGLSPALAARISVVTPNDPAGLARALGLALGAATQQAGPAPLALDDRALLSWQAYGKRYFDELRCGLSESSISRAVKM